MSGAGRHTLQLRGGTYGGANRSRDNLIIENYPGEARGFSGASNSRAEVLMFSDAGTVAGGQQHPHPQEPIGRLVQGHRRRLRQHRRPGALIIVWNDERHSTATTMSFCVDGLELDTNRSKWHGLASEAGYGVRLCKVSNGYIANCNIHGGASGLMGVASPSSTCRRTTRSTTTRSTTVSR